jgi:hypothetical protein
MSSRYSRNAAEAIDDSSDDSDRYSHIVIKGRSEAQREQDRRYISQGEREVSRYIPSPPVVLAPPARNIAPTSTTITISSSSVPSPRPVPVDKEQFWQSMVRKEEEEMEILFKKWRSESPPQTGLRTRSLSFGKVPQLSLTDWFTLMK